MTFAAIDPGASGSLCVLNSDDSVHFVDFKKEGLLGYISFLIDNRKYTAFAIEAVHAMPGQGVSSMFSFGQRLGELEGMLQTLSIPYSKVRPQAWQKACQIVPKSGKKGIFQVMSSLYPGAELTGPKGGIRDGRCDALGMAHYLKLQYEKENNE